MPLTRVVADTLVRTGAAVIYWVTFVNHSTGTLQQTIYDNTAASGTIVQRIRLPVTDTKHHVFDPPIPCATGIYAQYGGAGGELAIFWMALT